LTVIAITFDRAPQDTSSCCNQPTFANLGPAATPTPTPTTSPDPASPAPAASATPSPVASPTPTTTPADGLAVPGTPPGGGKVGLLLVSRYVKPGSLNVLGTYNHFSLLRSIEDLFGLEHLGYAADPALSAFDNVVYNAAR
jgi:hypothetical protein